MKKLTAIMSILLAMIMVSCDDGTPVQSDAEKQSQIPAILGICVRDQNGKLIGTPGPAGSLNGGYHTPGHIYVERDGYITTPFEWSFQDLEYWKQFQEDPYHGYNYDSGAIRISNFPIYPSNIYEMDLVWVEGQQRFKIRYEFESSLREFKFQWNCRVFVDGVEMPASDSKVFMATVVLDLNRLKNKKVD